MRTPEAPQRVLPHDDVAEVSVLGAMLQFERAVPVAMETLVPDDFYRVVHRHIFAACMTLFNEGNAVDLVTVGNELARIGKMEEVRSAYLAELVDVVPTGANVAHHVGIVKEKAVLRALIASGQEMTDRAYDDTERAAELVVWAEQQIMNVSQGRVKSAFTVVNDLLRPAFEKIEAVYEKKAAVTGVPTGYLKLDAMTTGLQVADLVIVAARPSIGKTSFALGVAEHVACEERTPVAVFSLEMTKEQVVQRLLCAKARVESRSVRTGYMEEADWPRLTAAAGVLSGLPIYIDDSANQTVLEMRAKARRLQAEKGLGLVIIDYLQLLTGLRKHEGRVQEVSEISRSLKMMAKDLGVPVVALSQLSRAVESRQPPRPQLSDLRESGSIEQDADVVVFLYRPSFYVNKDKEQDDPTRTEDNTTEVIIGKQRNGPTGTVHLAFLQEFGVFAEQERTRAG